MELQDSQDRLDAIVEGLGAERVAEFQAESLNRGGEQFLPNKDMISRE